VGAFFLMFRLPRLSDEELLWQWHDQDSDERFYTLSYARTDWGKLVQSTRAGGEHQIWMVEHGEAVGLIDLRYREEQALLSLYIAPSQRSKGYGQRVLSQARDILALLPEQVTYLLAEVESEHAACLSALSRSNWQAQPGSAAGWRLFTYFR
jgi:GNAT superfamily N-acetyltransferase